MPVMIHPTAIAWPHRDIEPLIRGTSIQMGTRT